MAPPFRGTDETLDREIETLEAIARLRLRRMAREMRDLDKDLRELKRERAKRRADSEVPTGEAVGAEGSAVP
jgi:hypothetical protein